MNILKHTFVTGVWGIEPKTTFIRPAMLIAIVKR